MIKYTTPISDLENILCFISPYSRFQSENERETEQYAERESAIVGSVPTIYDCI